MRRYNLTFIWILTLISLMSCSKTIFHSGEMVLDGTTVRYLVSEKELTLDISAEGNVPSSPIYVKLMEIDSTSCFTEKVIDSILSTPHENSVTLNRNREYGLFLEKNGETIGIGQFDL